jgi:hypothetical protein
MLFGFAHGYRTSGETTWRKIPPEISDNFSFN